METSGATAASMKAVGSVDVSDFAALLRRYAYAYTAAHDFDVCRALMVDDYVLRMGDAEILGRESSYIPAAQKQFRQYPGLGMTIHELVVGDNRAALRFSEHGRSALHGSGAVWAGISLYRWDGARLTECRVEQDYHARRLQQLSGTPHRVEAPGLDPWVAEVKPSDSESEVAVRRWLEANGAADSPIGSADDEHCAPADRLVIDDCETVVLDLFSAGSRVVFHTLANGLYSSGLGLSGHRGLPVSLYTTGMATVRDGSIADVRLVTDRLQAERRLLTIGGRN